MLLRRLLLLTNFSFKHHFGSLETRDVKILSLQVNPFPFKTFCIVLVMLVQFSLLDFHSVHRGVDDS
jgi:hypothetical protein